MSIKLAKQGSLYTAELTPPHGNWQSTRPMSAGELSGSLLSKGCDMNEILLSFKKAGFPDILSVKIVKDNSLYSAEVTLLDGKWKSPHPMLAKELWRALEAIGCRNPEITAAFDKVGFFPSCHQIAEEFGPQIQTALKGEREVPQQPPFAEAWLTYVLYEMDKELTIETLIEDADSLNHAIPTPDEISWALLQLRRRGWLLAEGDSYTLTVEGRRAVKKMADGGGVWERMKRLEGWISAHPPGTEAPRLRGFWHRKSP